MVRDNAYKCSPNVFFLFRADGLLAINSPPNQHAQKAQKGIQLHKRGTYVNHLIGDKMIINNVFIMHTYTCSYNFFTWVYDQQNFFLVERFFDSLIEPQNQHIFLLKINHYFELD